MTDAQQQAPKQIDPPAHITEVAFVLDDLLFEPAADPRFERASRDGVVVGDILFDDAQFWFARKLKADGTLSDWQPMRSAAEARAYLVSKVRR